MTQSEKVKMERRDWEMRMKNERRGELKMRDEVCLNLRVKMERRDRREGMNLE